VLRVVTLAGSRECLRGDAEGEVAVCAGGSEEDDAW